MPFLVLSVSPPMSRTLLFSRYTRPENPRHQIRYHQSLFIDIVQWNHVLGLNLAVPLIDLELDALLGYERSPLSRLRHNDLTVVAEEFRSQDSLYAYAIPTLRCWPLVLAGESTHIEA